MGTIRLIFMNSCKKQEFESMVMNWFIRLQKILTSKNIIDGDRKNINRWLIKA